jgi:hypothetical protein
MHAHAHMRVYACFSLVEPTTPVTTTASSETEVGTDLDQMPRAVQT